MLIITEQLYKKMPDEIKSCFYKLPNKSSEEVLELFPETKTNGVKTPFIGGASNKINIGGGNVKPYESNSGSAARFFYCAKASKSERNMGLDGFEEKNASHDGRDEFIENPYQRHDNLQKNFHPTVKPIKLMEYLVNLVSKEGHTVLDPFAGSGTTGIACKKLNRNFIGIERDEEYCKIAEARINNLTLN